MTSSEYRKLSKFLADIKIGVRGAFAGIYSMYEKKVYFLCCKILKSKNDAKKLTEDIFDYTYLQISNIGDAAGFEKWLYSTVFSKCRHFLLDNRPEVFGDYTDSDSSDGENVDILLVQDADEMMNHPDGIRVTVDMMQTVDSILSDLPQKVRNAALLHYFCGFDGDEIASVEQISYAAYRNRLYKARIRLGTEEHKYTEIGYNVSGFVTFLPDVLTTMAESIVIPGEIAAGVTSRTGINCMAESKRTSVSVSPTQNTTVIPAQKPKNNNYQTTAYAVRQAPSKPANQDVSPVVKVITAIVAILIIIGGTVAVTLAIQKSKEAKTDVGAVENFENNVVPTTIEIVTRAPVSDETTTEITTETTTVETTEATTVETTAETTTQETTESTTEETTVEETTQETTLPETEPAVGDNAEAEF